jgi:hypothetical protein
MNIFPLRYLIAFFFTLVPNVWKEKKTIKVDLKIFFLRAIENCCLESLSVQKKLRIENLVRLFFRVVGLVAAIVRRESEEKESQTWRMILIKSS